MAIEIKTAREIVKRAEKDEIYDGKTPENDAEVLKVAQEVIELAEQAYNSHVRTPEVMTILNLAANGNGKVEDQSDTGDEHAPPEVEAEEDSSTSVSFGDIPAEYAKSEPWDGYKDLSVKDVTEGISWFAENSPEDILEVLKNVWAYESAHKKRGRVLDFTVETYKRLGGDIEPEAETESAQESESEVNQSRSEDAGDVQGVSEEVGESESGTDTDDTNADVDTEPEISSESSEAESSDEAEPDAENQTERSGRGEKGPSAESKLTERVVEELRHERLDGIPSPPQEQAPELPWNWADVTDTQLHDLHMQYASLAYYKAYQKSRDDRIALHCKEAADELHNKLLVSTSKYDEKGKEIKVTVLEAQIASDPNIRRWRRVQRKYERFGQQARNELESLQKIVEALSRLETMRHNAYERSRR